MEEALREGNILEFKALTMSKRIFDQLREVKGESVEVIGWVKDGPQEWFVGKLGSALVKVSRLDMLDHYGREIGIERVREEARMLNMGVSQYLNIKLDQYRDSLPQIFIR